MVCIYAFAEEYRMEYQMEIIISFSCAIHIFISAQRLYFMHCNGIRHFMKSTSIILSLLAFEDFHLNVILLVCNVSTATEKERNHLIAGLHRLCPFHATTLQLFFSLRMCHSFFPRSVSHLFPPSLTLFC